MAYKQRRYSSNSNKKIPVQSPPRTKEALGQSDSFLAFQEALSRAAGVDRPVLLVGERGTGKELAAARLHYLSARWQGPLITLNCAALSSSLIESELFGHERGAFTGAEQRRKGRFEAADGGTLFLDEISSIPLEAQEKILRVVEYGTFERVGSSDSVQVDVRIVGATNSNLVSLSQEGRFKEDLLDRLCFEVLFLPPLRERKGDIALLATHFAVAMAVELGRKEIPQFTEGVMDALENYLWPGNVRELKNMVERAVFRSNTPMIESIDFHPFKTYQERLTHAAKAPAPTPMSPDLQLEIVMDQPFEQAVETFKISLIARALMSSRYNQQKAARALGLTYHKFRGIFRRHRKAVEGIMAGSNQP